MPQASCSEGPVLPFRERGTADAALLALIDRFVDHELSLEDFVEGFNDTLFTEDLNRFTSRTCRALFFTISERMTFIDNDRPEGASVLLTENEFRTWLRNAVCVLPYLHRMR